MFTFFHRTRRLLPVVVLAASVACGKSLASYEQSGDRFFQQKQYGPAAIQYLNALAKDPQRGDIRFKLAEAWYAEGNHVAAYPEYIRAADLMPDNTEAQLRAAYLLVRGGLFKEAKDRIRVVLQKDPKNLQGLLILGNALAGLHSLDEAEDVLKRAVEIDPERSAVYQTVGVMQLAQKELPEAEATFKRAVDVSKGAPDAYLALGTFYRIARKFPEAETALQQALAKAPNAIPVHEALAGLYMDTERPADAEKHLKILIDLKPDRDRVFALVDFYVSAGRQAEAIELLNKMAATPESFSVARNRVALIQFLGGKRADAMATVDDILKQRPGDAEALALKARLLLAEGQPEQALDVAVNAVRADRKSAQAHLAQARILLALNRLEDASKEFKETLAVQPDSLTAQLELADFHRTRSEYDTALGYLDAAIKAHPGNVDARLMRVQILLLRENSGKALEEIKELMTQFPRSTRIHSLLGRYYLAAGDRGSARASFERTLAIGPSTEALTGLVALDLSVNDKQAARARVDAALAKSPNAPDLLLLAAKVYGVAGDSQRAEQLLQKVVTVAPDNPTAYAMLAQLYVAQHRTEEAKARFADLVRADPRAISGHTMLGVLHYASGDYAKAREAWEAALRLSPAAPSAANNLAWLYAESGENLDRALQLA